jgi:hypothetical protein
LNHCDQDRKSIGGSLRLFDLTSHTYSAPGCPQQAFAKGSLRRLQLAIGGKIARLFSWYRY